MDKIQLELENALWDKELIGIKEQAFDCKNIALKFTLKFGEWLYSLTEEEIGDDSMENLLKFFKDEVY